MRKRVIWSLWAIFWGTFFCAFDLNVSDGGVREFDLFPDILGSSLVFLGTIFLGRIRIDAVYRRALLFVQVVAFLALLRSISELLVLEQPKWIGFARFLVFSLELAAALVFCGAMKWLSEYFELPYSPQNWRNTMFLVAVFYCVPFLGITVWSLCFYQTMDKSGQINLGAGGALLLLPMLIPLFHFALSTWRLRREFEL